MGDCIERRVNINRHTALPLSTEPVIEVAKTLKPGLTLVNMLTGLSHLPVLHACGYGFKEGLLRSLQLTDLSVYPPACPSQKYSWCLLFSSHQGVLVIAKTLWAVGQHHSDAGQISQHLCIIPSGPIDYRLCLRQHQYLCIFCTFIVLTEGFLSTFPVVPDNIHILISASFPFGLPTTLSFDVEIVWFCMCFICVHFPYFNSFIV